MSKKTIGEEIDLNIYIDMSKTLLNSPFIDPYLIDKHKKKKMKIAVFVLLNGEIVIFPNSEKVRYISADIDDKIMITPKIKINKLGHMEKLRFPV